MMKTKKQKSKAICNKNTKLPNKADFSTGYIKYRKKCRWRTFFVVFMQFFILALFIGLWEILTYYKIMDPFIFSSPSRILKTIFGFKQSELWKHISITLLETVLGFVLSTIIGTFIAILLYQSERARRIFEPYLIVLNSLPKIALGPMLIIWFGAGLTSIVVMCILICVILTTISMLNAFLEVDQGKIMLLKTMQASRWQILTKLILPAAFPAFITVLKVNVGLSWVGSIMGEYLVSKAGLGYLIIYGGQVFKLDLVMASTIILCFLAALMFFGVAYLEKRIKRTKK